MTPVIDNAVRGELMALQYERAERPTEAQEVRKLVLLCRDKEPPHELRKRWYDALRPRRSTVFRFGRYRSGADRPRRMKPGPGRAL
jgi:hypothetical protein